MTVELFAVPIFLICFRETLECVIIVSVLLAFLKQTLGGPDSNVQVYKKLRRQVWMGTGLGLLICLIIAAAIIGVFYKVGVNSWEGSEGYWEGSFALFASIVITIMGFALLRVGKMQQKWRVKLASALEKPLKIKGRGSIARFFEKYAMFVLPFVTVLREGTEAIVFVAGVSFTAPATAFPLPAITGFALGGLVGYLLYKSGSTFRLQLFLVASTCLLYLVAAGLFSRAVGYFESQKWNNILGGDASELGEGPGTYDIDQSVWHVNCCSPDLNGSGEGGWGIANAVFGWTNSATYGTVISYNLYWVFVMSAFVLVRFHEVKGHWPLMKAKQTHSKGSLADDASSQTSGSIGEKKTAIHETPVTPSP